jgi:hypothetical protein
MPLNQWNSQVKQAKQRIKMAIQVLRRGEAASQEKRLVPAITPQEVAEAKQFFPLEKFFIFGHARSGTTLLTRLVRVHPSVHCNYQAHFFTRAPLLESLVADQAVGAWLSRRSNRWNQGRDMSPLVLRAASDFIMERDARRVGKAGLGCVVGDKSPSSLLDGQAVRLMVKVYPDARLVYIIRDGRDAILSHRFQAFIDTHQLLSDEDLRIRQEFTNNPEQYLSSQRSIFTEKGLREEAQGWVKNVVETNDVAQDLLGDRYFVLQYEHLLQDPSNQMRRLWSFLGVDPASVSTEMLDAEMAQNPDADWQLQKAGDIVSVLKKGKRGSWREILTPRDQQLFWEIAGETLTAWGYQE